MAGEQKQLSLLEENSKWVAEHYPEFAKAAEKAGAEERAARAEKAAAKAAENAEYADKRVKASPLVAKAELAKMKAITGGGASGGYGEGDLEQGMKGSRMPKPKLKAGGKVKSASARADGCCVRGKTRA